MEAFRKDALARTIRLHHANRKLAIGILGEGDPLAIRRPDGCGIAALAEGNAGYITFLNQSEPIRWMIAFLLISSAGLIYIFFKRKFYNF